MKNARMTQMLMDNNDDLLKNYIESQKRQTQIIEETTGRKHKVKMDPRFDPLEVINSDLKQDEKKGYDFHIEIEEQWIDVAKAIDELDLVPNVDYSQSEDDYTKIVIFKNLDEDEYLDLQEKIDFNNCNEQSISSELLNDVFGKYTTKVTIYKPDGNVISFYSVLSSSYQVLSIKIILLISMRMIRGLHNFLHEA